MLSPHALYSVTEIRHIEHAALTALPPFTLMQRAGRSAAERALALLDGQVQGADILVLAGPGNNGGDALEAAAVLTQLGVNVTALLCAAASRQSADSGQALAHAKSSGVQFADPADFARIVSERPWALVIDGLFGIGLTRAISPPFSQLVSAVNELCCPILALDVPSGLDADNGNIIGEHGIAVRATDTITFIGNKPGLHTCFGRDYAGHVQVADLGIDEGFFKPTRLHLNVPESFTAFLMPRAHNTHKGSYGDVIVIGGANGMCGAAILAARASAKCGAGRVFAAFLTEPPAYDALQPELMCRFASDVDLSAGTLVVGPGLGTSALAHELLDKALASAAPLVLDADALNLIAADSNLQRKLRDRRCPAILTPHPLEAARLLGISVKQIQADRLRSAHALTRQFNAAVILKGSGSVIAQPNGDAAINTTGNAALATAGTGDVLAGICGALAAQGWPPLQAALGAAWLHGHAADILVAQGVGPIGLTASELIPCVRALLNQLTAQYARRRHNP